MMAGVQGSELQDNETGVNTNAEAPAQEGAQQEPQLQDLVVHEYELQEFDDPDSAAQPPAGKSVPTKKITEEYVLVNAYDELVRTNVRALMAKMDMCQCEKCYLDACALVFNRRYTHFVTTHRGALLTKVPEMSRSNQVEMTVVILEALRMVKSFPKH